MCSKRLLLLVCCSIFIIAACGTPPAATGSFTNTATSYTQPTATAFPPSTPFPGTTPVTTLAGWADVTSNHWAGYTYPTYAVTGVRARWNVSAVQATNGSSAEYFTWIGVGGWNETNNNIIQIGTYQYFPPEGGEHTGFWYELVPANPVWFPHPISSGDTIYGEVTEIHPNQWHLYLIDAALPEALLDVTVPFVSDHAYPSFIAEDPDAGAATTGDNGPFLPFPKWAPVTLHQIAIRVKDIWHAGAGIYAFRVTMSQKGRTIATASPLDTTSSFTLTEQQ